MTEEKIRQTIADGLAGYMKRERITMAQMGRGLGLSWHTIRKLTDGEDVKLPLTVLLRVVAMAGLKIVPKEGKRS